MQTTSEAIFQAALKLPENERLALAAQLLDTMPQDDPSIALDDPSFVEELDRRFADREGSITWTELRAE